MITESTVGAYPAARARRGRYSAATGQLHTESASQRDPARVAMITPPSRRRPGPADLRRGGRYGAHARPSTLPPEDPALVRQLLDRASRPDQVGLDDGNRPLRAGRVSDLFGMGE